jgi:hypothetical protein
MAGHRVIEQYLARLGRDLPAGIVDELADGLNETWRHHLAAGLVPDRAARAAIADFGATERIVAAFVTHSPGRRTARLLLATGPLVGICWAAALATGRAWTWHIPRSLMVLSAVVLIAVVVWLIVSATAVRNHRRASQGTYAGIAVIGLDLTMVIGALSAAPTISRLVTIAAAISLIRVALTTRAIPGALAAKSR